MKGVVVGVDGSECSARALVWAAREAQLHDWPVTAILAWDWLDQPHRGLHQDFDPGYNEADAEAVLDVYLEQALGSTRATNVVGVAVRDMAARALLEASVGASLLVLGPRGRGGFRRLLLGSVSQQCLHHAPCPVAIIRQETREVPTADRTRLERIVVGIDGSETARRALLWAVDECRTREASLEVVHAWEIPHLGGFPDPTPFLNPPAFESAARRTLDAVVDSIDTTGLAQPVGRSLVSAGAASAILKAGKGADLVVVGSRGLGGFNGLLIGSVGQQVAHHATCPVVIVPPES